jgi:hypothetical protein
MSGERPSPLWPEGFRKERNLPAVESRRTQAPSSGETSFVPKQGAGSGGQKPENQGRQIASTEQVDSPTERQANQESNTVLPPYLDDADRHFATEWIQPKKEVLHGWDNFAELAFDMANLLPKPDNAALAPDDIENQDYEDLVGKHLPADEWEESVIELLEHRRLDFKIPQFREDMQEYRKSVKAIVQLWRESGFF